jgi:hypothetical protein
MALRYKTLDFLNICSLQVREMYEHWAALRGDRILPHRDDLDPARITRYLPGIMLVDVQWGPPLDFVYRLVGTREVESRGADPTGRRVAEAYFATTVEDALDNYRYVATERAVLYDCEPVSRPGNRYVGGESVFLPFTLDGERVGQILVYSHYEDLWFRTRQP